MQELSADLIADCAVLQLALQGDVPSGFDWKDLHWLQQYYPDPPEAVPELLKAIAVADTFGINDYYEVLLQGLAVHPQRDAATMEQLSADGQLRIRQLLARRLPQTKMRKEWILCKDGEQTEGRLVGTGLVAYGCDAERRLIIGEFIIDGDQVSESRLQFDKRGTIRCHVLPNGAVYGVPVWNVCHCYDLLTGKLVHRDIRWMYHISERHVSVFPTRTIDLLTGEDLPVITIGGNEMMRESVSPSGRYTVVQIALDDFIPQGPAVALMEGEQILWSLPIPPGHLPTKSFVVAYWSPSESHALIIWGVDDQSIIKLDEYWLIEMATRTATFLPSMRLVKALTNSHLVYQQNRHLQFRCLLTGEDSPSTIPLPPREDLRLVRARNDGSLVVFTTADFGLVRARVQIYDRQSYQTLPWKELL